MRSKGWLGPLCTGAPPTHYSAASKWSRCPCPRRMPNPKASLGGSDGRMAFVMTAPIRTTVQPLWGAAQCRSACEGGALLCSADVIRDHRKDRERTPAALRTRWAFRCPCAGAASSGHGGTPGPPHELGNNTNTLRRPQHANA